MFTVGTSFVKARFTYRYRFYDYIFHLKLNVMKARITVYTPVVLFIAALFAFGTPANAQRRTTRTTVVTKKSEEKSSSDNGRKKVEEKKEVKKETIRSESSRRSTPAPKREATPARPANRSSAKPAPAGNQQRSRQPAVPAPTKKTVPQRQPVKQNAPQRRNPANNKEVRSNISIQKNNQPLNPPANPRTRVEHNRTVYRVNPGENRYKPEKGYKGGNNNWSVKQATYHIHYTGRDDHYYRHYDHRRYRHWDPVWESYLWSVNSWRDYYSGYHPQSYRFSKHYYIHPVYGHVLRKFTYKPVYFVHNNIRYYNYNGHFFRHFKGVGYVLADMPYGIVFKKLPAGYDRVYINGYLYFRVGNLFLESTPGGFALIHYPERYYSLDADYYNGGYYSPVDFTIHF